MRKAFGTLFTVAVLAFAGLGMAQKYGFYAGYGYDGMLGGQFFLGDNLRASIGVTPLVGIAVGGSLDFMLGRVNLMKESKEKLEFYYGVGGGGGIVTVPGAAGFYVQGHGLGGVEFGLPNSNLSFFTELGMGPTMIFAGGSGLFTFAYDAKFGLLFR